MVFSSEPQNSMPSLEKCIFIDILPVTLNFEPMALKVSSVSYGPVNGNCDKSH